jgi:hypothetical protein
MIKAGVIEVDSIMLIRDFFDELQERMLTVEHHLGYCQNEPHGQEYAFQQGKLQAYADISLLLCDYADEILENSNTSNYPHLDIIE